jgi:hypothetical protein
MDSKFLRNTYFDRKHNKKGPKRMQASDTEVMCQGY